MAAIDVKQTRLYKLAFELAMEIFDVSQMFPKEEKYSLTDQIRRSSRSVCICLWKLIEKSNINFISSQKLRIVIWKIPKQEVGLTFPWPVNTLTRRHLQNFPANEPN